MRVSGGSAVKNMPANAGISGAVELPWMDPWVWKIPWKRKWQFTPVFLLGKSHRQRNLLCCGLYSTSEFWQHPLMGWWWQRVSEEVYSSFFLWKKSAYIYKAKGQLDDLLTLKFHDSMSRSEGFHRLFLLHNVGKFSKLLFLNLAQFRNLLEAQQC